MRTYRLYARSFKLNHKKLIILFFLALGSKLRYTFNNKHSEMNGSVIQTKDPSKINNHGWEIEFKTIKLL